MQPRVTVKLLPVLTYVQGHEPFNRIGQYPKEFTQHKRKGLEVDRPIDLTIRTAYQEATK